MALSGTQEILLSAAAVTSLPVIYGAGYYDGQHSGEGFNQFFSAVVSGVINNQVWSVASATCLGILAVSSVGRHRRARALRRTEVIEE